jgi:hypothetical protein
MRIRFLGALLACVLMSGGSTGVVAGAKQTAPQSADAQMEIDPACLWPVVGGSLNPDAPPTPSSVPLDGCAPARAELTSDEDGWRRLSFEDADDFGAQRYTGVRLAALEAGEIVALEVYDNGGGSGVFTSLVTGNLDEAVGRLNDIQVFGFGDRCNGGLAHVRQGASGQLLATANMTPWDIMMSVLPEASFSEQWAAGQSRFGDAFGAAASCAICCSGVTQEYELSGTELRQTGLRSVAISERTDDDPLSSCLVEAVQSSAGADDLVTQAEMALLDVAISQCALLANSK